MEFCERLKKIRTERQMTQEEVAETVFVKRQTVSKWELGITEPDLQTLERLAQLFDVTIDELVREKVNTEKKNHIPNILFLVSFCLVIINIITTLIYLKFLPNQIPMHYNSNFEVDRIGSKYETLLFIVCYIIFYLPSLIGLLYSRKKNNGRYNTTSLIIITSIVSIFFQFAFGIFVLCVNSKYLIKDSFLSIFSAECGVIMLICSLLIHPKINRNINLFFGIRTKFSLENKDNWYKLNRFGSFTLIIASLASILLAVFLNKELFFICFIPFVISLITIFIYEYVLKRRQNI